MNNNETCFTVQNTMTTIDQKRILETSFLNVYLYCKSIVNLVSIYNTKRGKIKTRFNENVNNLAWK